MFRDKSLNANDYFNNANKVIRPRYRYAIGGGSIGGPVVLPFWKEFNASKNNVFFCDNGPEFTSRHFLAWCEEQQIRLIHIQPGRPMQNGRVESFNGRLRDECLNANWFPTMSEAKRKIEAWREEYNRERPHSSLGYRTPEEFARGAAFWDAPSGASQSPCSAVVV